MKPIFSNKDYNIIRFNDIIYMKTLGFHEIPDLTILIAEMKKFIQSYKGTSFSVYHDVSEKIISTPTTANHFNINLLELTKSINIKQIALFYSKNQDSYIHEFIQHFYLRDVAADVAAFTDHNTATNWIQSDVATILELKEFLNNQ